MGALLAIGAIAALAALIAKSNKDGGGGDASQDRLPLPPPDVLDAVRPDDDVVDLVRRAGDGTATISEVAAAADELERRGYAETAATLRTKAEAAAAAAVERLAAQRQLPGGTDAPLPTQQPPLEGGDPASTGPSRREVERKIIRHAGDAKRDAKRDAARDGGRDRPVSSDVARVAAATAQGKKVPAVQLAAAAKKAQSQGAPRAAIALADRATRVTVGNRPTIKRGSRDPHRATVPGTRGFTVTNPVREAQGLLNQAGSDAGTADGIFGSKTHAAAVQFQSTHTEPDGTRLTADGIIGPKTWSALLNQ